MKKYLIISLFMSCLMAHSQNLFTLEKTLEGQFNLQSTQYDENDVYVDQIPYVNLTAAPCDMGYLYNSTCSGNTLTYTLVSPEYEVSTKKYTFDLPSGNELSISYPTNKLTPDKSLLFFNECRNSSGLQSCGIYDSKGKLVQSFAKNVYVAYMNAFLYRINGAYKLLVYKADLVGSDLKYTTDVYTFQTQTDLIQNVKEEKTPLRIKIRDHAISIPYSNNIHKAPLLIMDSNGAVIDSKQLHEVDGTAVVNISTYRPGIYLYKIGEQTDKFVVK